MSFHPLPSANQSPEVSGARSRLTDVLQNLVEKAEKNVEDGTLDDELKESPKTPEEDSKVGILDGSRSSRKHHKRKRKKDYHSRASDYGSPEKSSKYHQSFVMKLFDRQVDLAQFRSSSPLYPVCREWMYNQPLKKRCTRTRTPSPEPPEDDGSDLTDPAFRDVYHLPPPSISAEQLFEKNNRDPRIPSPEPQPAETWDIHADMNQAPSTDALLEGHLTRWRNIKNKWKTASDDYQSRYNESFSILKAMYDRV